MQSALGITCNVKLVGPREIDRSKGKAVRVVDKRKLSAYITSFKNLLALHGGYSLNVHAANGMAAMFQAFGQDMAYLGECSQAILDCHFTGPDSLEDCRR